MRLAALAVSFLFLAASAMAQGSDAETRWSELESRYRRSQQEAVDLDALRASMADAADAFEASGHDSLATLALDSLNELQTRSSDIAAAQATLERAIAIAQRAGLPGREAQLMMSLSITYALQGDLERMIADTKQNIPRFEAMADTLMLARSWGNLSVAYMKLGRVLEAVETNAKAIPLARSQDNTASMSSAYARASELLQWQGRFQESVAYADSAIAIARRENWLLQLSSGLIVKALSQQALSDVAAALVTMDEAIALRRQMGDELYIPMPLMGRARFLLELDRFAEAEEATLELRPIVERQGDPTQILQNEASLGTIMLEQGRHVEAQVVLSDAANLYESERAKLGETESQMGLFTSGGEVYAALARCYHIADDLDAAWASLERGRAPLLREYLGHGQDSISIEKLRSRLRQEDAVLLQFNDPRLNPTLAILVQPSGSQAFESSFLSPILKDAQAALDLMSSGADDAACAPVLGRLGEALLPPGLAELPPLVRRLFLVAPTELSGFPFEVLPFPTADNPQGALGDRFAISYLPSASSLEALIARPRSTQTIVAFADPVLSEGSAGSSAWGSFRGEASDSRLPRARDEVNVLDIEGAHIYMGEDASREQVDQDHVRHASVLHFATHALVQNFSPETSCLLLAGSNGMLAASEVQELQLEADLVTLSACRTSGGYVYLGEGTFGLTRSFLVAGARSIVASLWDVEDAAAAQFMTHFYGALRAGTPRDESLRAARAAMAAEGYSHRDRSAFVLIGAGHEPVAALAAAPLPQASSPLIWFMVAGVGFILIVARSIRRA